MPFLADDLFLMAHDLQSGKPRSPDSTLRIGLAGALLAELMFCGCVVVTQSRLLPGACPPPQERLAQALFEQLRTTPATRHLPVSDWIAGHRQLTLELVADRLVQHQHVVTEQRRRLGRATVRYLPVNPTDVFMRGQRLSTFLKNRMELTELDVVLASLAMRVSVGSPLIELDDDGRDHLQRLVPQLPAPLRDLLAATENAVDAAQRGPRG